MTDEEIGQRLKNFDLISDAFNAEPLENEFLDKFKTMIEDDFMMKLCNEVQGANDAKNLEKMKGVLNEMRLIAECPELHSKSIGAIGGGFSSGKSTFINSFLEGVKPEEKLAEGVNPVTVIPSYVVCDTDFRISGISFEGGRFSIASEMYKNLSHDNVKKSFSFLNRLVSYAAVHAPMKSEYFSNLCLIDTPGYNPQASGSTKRDATTARDSIKKAGFLVWLIGLDVNGTIPKGDIEFLREMKLFGIKSEYPLYIVANKARVKTQSAIEEILKDFEKTLNEKHLRYEGITAYDSKSKKVYAHRKKPLFDFFAEHNKPSKRYAGLKQTLNEVFADYIGAVREKYDWADAKRKEIVSIRLDVRENVGPDEGDKLAESLNSLMKSFKLEGTLEDANKKVRDIKDSFVTCLDDFCGKAKIPRIENRFCRKCGTVIQGNETLCGKCEGRNK